MNKFEKKTRFSTQDLQYMAAQNSHGDIINQRAELAQHVIECHDEIERQSNEMVRGAWIDTKGNEEMVLEPDCVYLFACKYDGGTDFYRTDIPVGSVSVGLVLYSMPTCYKYKRLTGSLKDSESKPRPIEVKVGKYRWGSKGKTCWIMDIGAAYCVYRFSSCGGIRTATIAEMKYMMEMANATLVEEDAEDLESAEKLADSLNELECYREERLEG